MSDSLRPYEPEPSRLLCPWDFSRHKYWSGLPCPLPGDLPNPGIKPTSLMSSALTGRFFTASATWEAPNIHLVLFKILVAQMVKNLPACGRPEFHPWVGKIPWRKEWQPTLVFLPGESPWTEEPSGLQSSELRVRHA